MAKVTIIFKNQIVGDYFFTFLRVYCSHKSGRYYLFLNNVANTAKKMDTIILRQKPLFKIELQNESFKLTNEADTNDNATYLFEKIKSISLHEKRVNWFVWAFSYVFGSLIGGGSGEIFKERNQIKICC